MTVNEQDISQLTAMGFSESQALEALTVCGGNLENAINFILVGGEAYIPAVAPSAESNALGVPNSAISVGGLFRCSQSQYSVANGRSACTCIALTAASKFLQDQTVTSKFLEQMISQGVANYQQLSTGSNVEHLSAEEVLQKDKGSLFPLQIRAGGVRQGVLSNDFHHPLGLKSLLEGLRHAIHGEWMVILITKTPETVLLCFPPDSVSPSSYWLIDSHPRPQLGMDSAYAKLHPGLDSLLMSLQAIFPCTDLGADVPEMMAMMYNSFDLYPLQLVK